MTIKKLSFDEKMNLTVRMLRDYCYYRDNGFSHVPSDQRFSIEFGRIDNQQERMRALAELESPIKKVAFDSRFVDQERERNPRENLQYWQRTQEFTPLDVQRKVGVLSKIQKVTGALGATYGNQQEWLQSYARQLDDHLKNATMVKDGGVVEVFESQVDYLEQILDTRYLLRLAEVEKMTEEEIGKIILAKDNKLAGKIVAIGAPVTEEKKPDVDSKSIEEALSKVLSTLNEKKEGRRLLIIDWSF